MNFCIVSYFENSRFWKKKMFHKPVIIWNDDIQFYQCLNYYTEGYQYFIDTLKKSKSILQPSKSRTRCASNFGGTAWSNVSHDATPKSRKIRVILYLNKSTPLSYSHLWYIIIMMQNWYRSFGIIIIATFFFRISRFIW